MPRRGGRRKTRRGNGNEGSMIRYAFSTRVRVGVSFLTFGSLAISADFPCRVRKVSYTAVSNGTAAIQVVLYGPNKEVVAESRPAAVSYASRGGLVMAPQSTDFHQPSNDEYILGIRMTDPQPEQTTILVAGQVFVEIRSSSVMTSIKLINFDDQLGPSRPRAIA